jgi:hypothetical protein
VYQVLLKIVQIAVVRARAGAVATAKLHSSNRVAMARASKSCLFQPDNR